MDEERKKKLWLLSMSQWKAIHGAKASERVYKDPKTGKWVTWDDIAQIETKRTLSGLEVAERLKR